MKTIYFWNFPFNIFWTSVGCRCLKTTESKTTDKGGQWTICHDANQSGMCCGKITELRPPFLSGNKAKPGPWYNCCPPSIQHELWEVPHSCIRWAVVNTYPDNNATLHLCYIYRVHSAFRTLTTQPLQQFGNVYTHAHMQKQGIWPVRQLESSCFRSQMQLLLQSQCPVPCHTASL
jgi:hypothetical protein